MITIYLKPHKEESLLRFHPWVFSGAIRSIQLDKDYPYDSPKEGEIVQVVDSKGKVLGVGHYQIGSIAVRILSFGIDHLPINFWNSCITSFLRYFSCFIIYSRHNFGLRRMYSSSFYFN